MPEEKDVPFGDLLSLVTHCCGAIQSMAGHAACNGIAFDHLSTSQNEFARASGGRLSLKSREWLEEAIRGLDAVMQKLGDQMNGADCCCAEDQEATEYAFDAVERWKDGRYGEDRLDDETEPPIIVGACDVE